MPVVAVVLVGFGVPVVAVVLVGFGMPVVAVVLVGFGMPVVAVVVVVLKSGVQAERPLDHARRAGQRHHPGLAAKRLDRTG